MITTIRVDSNPFQNSTLLLGELLTKHSIKTSFSRTLLAAKLGVSTGTLKNWERGWTQPNRRFWQKLHLLLYALKPPT
jgi:DNA-binding transcriptional regulator YiaG